jgi:hypothetical protein
MTTEAVINNRYFAKAQRALANMNRAQLSVNRRRQRYWTGQILHYFELSVLRELAQDGKGNQFDTAIITRHIKPEPVPSDRNP